MKKDIQIPIVTDVHMAIAYEYNTIFKSHDWNVYIINQKEIDLEMVLIVSQGYEDNQSVRTSKLRHKIEKLPANSFAKVELLQDDVVQLTNSFQVTFFEGNTMSEKTFVFKQKTVKEGALRTIPVLGKRGILAK